MNTELVAPDDDVLFEHIEPRIADLKVVAGLTSSPTLRMHCLTEVLRLRARQLAADMTHFGTTTDAATPLASASPVHPGKPLPISSH